MLKEMSLIPPAMRAPFIVDRNQQVWGVTLDSETVDEKQSLAQIAESHRGDVFLVRLKSFSPDNKVFDYSSTQRIQLPLGKDNFIPSLVKQFFWPVDVMIHKLSDDSSGAAAGIKENDVIVALNGKPISHFQELINHVAQMKEFESVQMQVYRGGELLSFDVVPKSLEIDGEMKKLIGVYTSMVLSPPRMVQTPSSGFFTSISKAFLKTWEMTKITVNGYMNLISGSVSLKSVGGPIAIAKVAADSFSISLSYFFKIMAVISVNLAIINLFPLPVLDGGHILFIFIETVTRRPISPKIVGASMKFGVAILFVLIFMALYNDISRYVN